jgi:hypothetical protein
MPISLYDLSVPSFLQTVNAVATCLDRAVRHFAETGGDVEQVVTARLVPDMAPFHFQIEAMTHHAVWGVEAVMTGAFAPPPLVGAVPFANLRAMVGDAARALSALRPDAVNGWSGREFEIALFRPVDELNASTSAWAPRRLAFTSETFLLSYALPNFYFHAVTAYDILRTQGVPIGKGDFEGRLRTRAG